MSTVDELLKQKRELEEKKLALEKYRMEFRKLQGDINTMAYRVNSKRASHLEWKMMDDLKAKRREKVAELQRNFEISLQQIPVQILVYEDELIAIQLQLEGANLEHTHLGEQQPQSVPDRNDVEITGNQSPLSPVRQSRSDGLEDDSQNSLPQTLAQGGRER